MYSFLFAGRSGTPEAEDGATPPPETAAVVAPKRLKRAPTAPIGGGKVGGGSQGKGHAGDAVNGEEFCFEEEREQEWDGGEEGMAAAGSEPLDPLVVVAGSNGGGLEGDDG